MFKNKFLISFFTVLAVALTPATAQASTGSIVVDFSGSVGDNHFIVDASSYTSDNNGGGVNIVASRVVGSTYHSYVTEDPHGPSLVPTSYLRFVITAPQEDISLQTGDIEWGNGGVITDRCHVNDMNWNGQSTNIWPRNIADFAGSVYTEVFCESDYVYTTGNDDIPYNTGFQTTTFELIGTEHRDLLWNYTGDYYNLASRIITQPSHVEGLYTPQHSLPVEIHGGGGNDWIVDSSGPGKLHGGDGNDIFELARNEQRVVYVTYDNISYSPRLTGDDDIVYGDNGNDTITTGVGDDLIYPGAGDDTVFPGQGEDTIVDGAGDDTYQLWNKLTAWQLFPNNGYPYYQDFAYNSFDGEEDTITCAYGNNVLRVYEEGPDYGANFPSGYTVTGVPGQTLEEQDNFETGLAEDCAAYAGTDAIDPAATVTIPEDTGDNGEGDNGDGDSGNEDNGNISEPPADIDDETGVVPPSNPTPNPVPPHNPTPPNSPQPPAVKYSESKVYFRLSSTGKLSSKDKAKIQAAAKIYKAKDGKNLNIVIYYDKKKVSKSEAQKGLKAVAGLFGVKKGYKYKLKVSSNKKNIPYASYEYTK